MNFKNNLLTFSGSLLARSPKIVDRFIQYRKDSLRIVYYHVVSDNNPEYYFPNKSIRTDEFEVQLNFFKKNYDVIGFEDACNLAKNNKSLEGKLVLSFDDGFKENYSIIAPMLLNFKMKGIFYLIGNCIGNKDLMWRNKLVLINKVEKVKLNFALENISKKYNLTTCRNNDLMNWSFNNFTMNKKEEIVNTLWSETMNLSIKEYMEDNSPYMNESQIKELDLLGFEFGSHSMSHPIFSKLSYNEFKEEIFGSIKIIEKIIGKDVKSFSYPFGKRAHIDYERKLNQEKGCTIVSLLGTRNRLDNLSNNIRNWERDNMENSFENSISRFTLLSLLRSLI